MGFGPLRVINEDRVAPGAGFEKHAHQDVEILSWVLSGTLEHKDSLGTGATIQPGEMQRMSAGTGVTHSEFNASNSEIVHFLQIWILPNRKGIAPGYEQHSFEPSQLTNQWCLAASGAPRDGAVHVHQDLNLYIARLTAGQELVHSSASNRKLWLQVSRGDIEIDGETFRAGDGIGWTDTRELRVRANSDNEILLFDMIS
jgi:redox-sensitive bicupin YhaK (pirin superfamily)